MKKIISNTDYQTIVSYSQNKEDIFLESLFPNIEEGFYIDVGAAHPHVLSVTKKFYNKGWSGINIEPNPRLYQLLKRERPRDITINAAIVNDETVELSLREYLGDGLSTLSKEIKSQHAKSKSHLTSYYKDYRVNGQSLKSLLIENSLHGGRNHLRIIKFSVINFGWIRVMFFVIEIGIEAIAKEFSITMFC